MPKTFYFVYQGNRMITVQDELRHARFFDTPGYKIWQGTLMKPKTKLIETMPKKAGKSPAPATATKKTSNQ